MPWVAPDVVVSLPPRPASERASLDGFLDRHRSLLLAACSGLDGDQLALRPVRSSRLSLLGLVRHLAETERIWFRWRFAAEDVEPLFQTDDEPEGPFDLVDPAEAERDLETFRAEVERVKHAVAGRSLDEEFVFGRARTRADLRYVYVHMIEEYAQHNGHADLLRELVDGRVASDG
jgi:hypothetical protein